MSNPRLISHLRFICCIGELHNISTQKILPECDIILQAQHSSYYCDFFKKINPIILATCGGGGNKIKYKRRKNLSLSLPKKREIKM